MRSEERGFLTGLGAAAALLFILAGTLTFLLDPFYHYHAPWFGLRAVLTDKEYQVPGTLRHFEYDAVLAGSSVVENNDNRWFEEAFGCRLVKAVRSYGTVPDLVWYTELAMESRPVRRVFFNLDPAALVGDGELTFESTGCPMYLYDSNPWNDVKYLLNKTVLFEKIPYEIAQSFSASYEPALSYNWAEGKNFSRQGALEQYWRNWEPEGERPEDFYEENSRRIAELLTEMTRRHPETSFTFFLPPYSMLWWDDTKRNGDLSAYFHSEDLVVRALLECPNAEVFSFQGEEEIVSDLDRYMDTLHFDPAVNEWMVEAMRDGKNCVTKENWQQVLSDTRAMGERLLAGPIASLEAQGAFH